MTLINFPDDQRTTAQKLIHAHQMMDRAIFEEAYIIVSMYATDIFYYLAELESDVRYFVYHDEYVECGILND